MSARKPYCIVDGTYGLTLVPVDPTMLDGEVLIDLSDPTEEQAPVSRTTTPKMDKDTLAALVAQTRRKP